MATEKKDINMYVDAINIKLVLNTKIIMYHLYYEQSFHSFCHVQDRLLKLMPCSLTQDR